jgi:glycoprotein 3-alpha-L-fucosyltransferase
MGAHPLTYMRYAPPNSYIHVDDFESPRALAEYLNLIDSKDKLFNKYFEWKSYGELGQNWMWCRICALLHAPKPTIIYHNLTQWWSVDRTCDLTNQSLMSKRRLKLWKKIFLKSFKSMETSL